MLMARGREPRRQVCDALGKVVERDVEGVVGADLDGVRNRPVQPVGGALDLVVVLELIVRVGAPIRPASLAVPGTHDAE